MLCPSKYSFWWTPKLLTGRRSMRAQKGTANSDPYRNVMYDKRVIRGSNYGATAVLAEVDPFDKAAQARRRNALRKKILARNQRNIIGTPPPVIGRRHEIIQTEQYLEELLLHPPVKSADTQTDLFLEPPPTPPYFVSSKIGIDVGTSIEDGDLAEITDEDTNFEEPLIERFVEACILETAHEVECEEFEDFSKKVLEKKTAQAIQNAMDTFTTQMEKTNREPSESLIDEVAQIVDSKDILGFIIEEIVQQREKACVVATKILLSDDEAIDESETV